MLYLAREIKIVSVSACLRVSNHCVELRGDAAPWCFANRTRNPARVMSPNTFGTHVGHTRCIALFP